MERIRIEGSDKTPRVLLDADKSILQIHGRSVPENAEEFYDAIFAGLRRYFDEVKSPIEVTVDLEYFNTSSARQLLLLFQSLQKKESSIIWVFESGDDDMEEAGEDFQSMLTAVRFILRERPHQE
jgi:hypothetical protein